MPYFMKNSIIRNGVSIEIIGLIEDKSTITQVEMANLLEVTPRMIRYHLKKLVDKNYITRIGAKMQKMESLTNALS